MSAGPSIVLEPSASTGRTSRRFVFERDALGFPNELVWVYRFDDPDGRMRVCWRTPKPTYTHRCFVLARMAHLFAAHAEFRPDLPAMTAAEVERAIRAVLRRSPRREAGAGGRVVFRGWPGLRALSRDHEALVKRLGGGAWRSYALRSHWRMVAPITRRHQVRTAAALAEGLKNGGTRVLHLVRFPSLTINHGIMAYAARPDGPDWEFEAYDPNHAGSPVTLRFESATRTFTFPANAYWRGGRLDVLILFQSPWM